MRKVWTMAAVAALLGACEARVGEQANEAERARGEAGAEAGTAAPGRAEEGRFTLNAPGFDLSLSIPSAIRDAANLDDESGLVPTGARLSGVHIQGRNEARAGGSVELRYSSDQAPSALAAWYRDPARAADFAVAEAVRDGEGYRISGTRTDGDRFTVRLAPRAGGTDGRILLDGGG